MLKQARRLSSRYSFKRPNWSTGPAAKRPRKPKKRLACLATPRVPSGLVQFDVSIAARLKVLRPHKRQVSLTRESSKETPMCHYVGLSPAGWLAGCLVFSSPSQTNNHPAPSGVSPSSCRSATEGAHYFCAPCVLNLARRDTSIGLICHRSWTTGHFLAHRRGHPSQWPSLSARYQTSRVALFLWPAALA